MAVSNGHGSLKDYLRIDATISFHIGYMGLNLCKLHTQIRCVGLDSLPNL